MKSSDEDRFPSHSGNDFASYYTTNEIIIQSIFLNEFWGFGLVLDVPPTIVYIHFTPRPVSDEGWHPLS